jgi:hypothetical protein
VKFLAIWRRLAVVASLSEPSDDDPQAKFLANHSFRSASLNAIVCEGSAVHRGAGVRVREAGNDSRQRTGEGCELSYSILY